MPKFRIHALGELARQLEFTPHDARWTQLAAAEELLHVINPLKVYPYDFIVHRITGYTPKAYSEELLTGLAIQHDLGLLIEQVSDTLNVRTDRVAEPVLNIADVSERFNVTSKTIQRWRRRGLPARRFIFADGKRRVGFLLGSVERFLGTHHQEQVDRGMNFSQVSPLECEEIVRRARRLAIVGRCGEQEIARRVARKVSRSPLMMLHTIRKHDAEHPDDAVFIHAAPKLTDDERLRIARGCRRGVSIARIARRLNRPRSAVYRSIIEDRLVGLHRRKITFIDDALYHQPEADEALSMIASEGEMAPAPVAEEVRTPRDLPPYLQALYRTPLLTPARERALFLQFNFHKYQFVASRRQVEPQFAKARDVEALEAIFRRVTETKNQIVRANLRLVVSVARKHLRAKLSLMELISDGNITLMRAVESFDIHRGNRFSTYATLALMKGFARSVPQMIAARVSGGAGTEALAQVPDYRLAESFSRYADREQVGQLLACLSESERGVMLAHYGLDGHEQVGYEQMGAHLGISRRQIRQLEESAMSKLRAIMGVAAS